MSCDGTNPLEAMKEDLDQVALPIKLAVQAMLLLPLGLRMNDGLHSPIAHGLHEVVRVVASVIKQGFALGVRKQLFGSY